MFAGTDITKSGWVVNGRMLFATKKLKVLNSIVEPIPIFVVNYLRGIQPPPQKSFHNFPVFEGLAKNSVPVNSDMTTLIARMIFSPAHNLHPFSGGTKLDPMIFKRCQDSPRRTIKFLSQAHTVIKNTFAIKPTYFFFDLYRKFREGMSFHAFSIHQINKALGEDFDDSA